MPESENNFEGAPPELTDEEKSIDRQIRLRYRKRYKDQIDIGVEEARANWKRFTETLNPAEKAVLQKRDARNAYFKTLNEKDTEGMRKGMEGER